MFDGADPVQGAGRGERAAPAQPTEPGATPFDHEEAGGVAEAHERPDHQQSPSGLLVRVLGDIDVVGGRLGLTALQTAVVSYIALHGPVTASRLEDAVWTAPTANRRKRLANTVSEARSALGGQHLPPLTEGRYRVGEDVDVDVQLLEEAVVAAATQPPEAAVETLRTGLSLVRGAPFGYRSSDRRYFAWVDFDNEAVATEMLVIDAACRMGELCVAGGEPAGAIWAASRGLMVSPTSSELTELLMRAVAAAGDRRMARRVFERHRNALSSLDLDDVAESTVELYRELVGANPSTAR